MAPHPRDDFDTSRYVDDPDAARIHAHRTDLHKRAVTVKNGPSLEERIAKQNTEAWRATKDDPQFKAAKARRG